MKMLCNKMLKMLSSKSRVKSKPPRHSGPAHGPKVSSAQPGSGANAMTPARCKRGLSKAAATARSMDDRSKQRPKQEVARFGDSRHSTCVRCVLGKGLAVYARVERQQHFQYYIVCETVPQQMA